MVPGCMILKNLVKLLLGLLEMWSYGAQKHQARARWFHLLNRNLVSGGLRSGHVGQVTCVGDTLGMVGGRKSYCKRFLEYLFSRILSLWMLHLIAKTVFKHNGQKKFLKVATTLMDLLFIQLVLHVKQMFSQQCQQHLDFPRGLPSKYCTIQAQCYLSVRMGTGVSNKAWSSPNCLPLHRHHSPLWPQRVTRLVLSAGI